MGFLISTDTSCDEYRSKLTERNISYVPLTYIIDGVSYEDHFTKEEDFTGFYDLIRQGAMPKTSQINVATHEDFFTKVLTEKQGTELIHVCLSSGLSGTYESACSAAQTVMEQIPGSKIFVIDSLSATHGSSFLLDKAEEMQKNGANAEETFEVLEELKTRINHWVFVDDLHHLKRGGRVSGASAVIGSLLKIKPILYMNDLGKLIVAHKCIGTKKAIRYLIDMVQKHKETEGDGEFVICHANAHENVETAKGYLEELYPTCPISVRWIGPVIGSHTGIGVFTIIFVGKDKRLSIG